MAIKTLSDFGDPNGVGGLRIEKDLENFCGYLF
jgi:hypothetical protein